MMRNRLATGLLLLGVTLLIWDVCAVVVLDPFGPSGRYDVPSAPSHHSPVRTVTSAVACLLAGWLFRSGNKR
jgi:hypothetical protein